MRVNRPGERVAADGTPSQCHLVGTGRSCPDDCIGTGNPRWNGDIDGDGKGPGGRIHDDEFTSNSGYVEESTGSDHVVERNRNP